MAKNDLFSSKQMSLFGCFYQVYKNVVLTVQGRRVLWMSRTLRDRGSPHAAGQAIPSSAQTQVVHYQYVETSLFGGFFI